MRALLVVLAWSAMSVVAAIPFLLEIPGISFTDAMFEDSNFLSVERKRAPPWNALVPRFVTRLSTPKKALVPYNADPGPRTTSMRSTSCRSLIRSYPT